jgi:hypothetical protein
VFFLRRHSQDLLFAATLLACTALSAQIKLNPTSVTIRGVNLGPPVSIANKSAQFTLQGLPPGTPIQAIISYAPNEKTNWLDATVSGNNITVTTNSSANSLGQGSFGAYLNVRVGTINLRPATIILPVSPQDNQFLFYNTAGNQIPDGVKLSTSSPQQSIWITYGGDFGSSKMNSFQLMTNGSVWFIAQIAYFSRASRIGEIRFGIMGLTRCAPQGSPLDSDRRTMQGIESC